MKTLPDGSRVIGTITAGSKIVSYNGLMVAIHPEHPPKVIDFNGIRDLDPIPPDVPLMVPNPFSAYQKRLGQLLLQRIEDHLIDRDPT